MFAIYLNRKLNTYEVRTSKDIICQLKKIELMIIDLIRLLKKDNELK